MEGFVDWFAEGQFADSLAIFMKKIKVWTINQIRGTGIGKGLLDDWFDCYKAKQKWTIN